MTAKKTYITVLNVYSCLSVVLLHGSAFWNFRKTPGWIADNFVESFFYFAVPVFVMLSGATLMDYRERCTTKEYFKKRVRKTVIPFLFWSIVGLFFVIWRDGSGSGYLLYALVGYYLDAYMPSRKVRIPLYLLGILGFAALFLGTLFLSYRDGAINQLFKGYVNLPCVLYATAVFLFFKAFPFDKLPQWLLRVLTFFGGQTFGIYLIHVQLMTIFNKALHIVPQSFAERMGFAVLIFVLSGLLTKLLQKIPVLKQFIP